MKATEVVLDRDHLATLGELSKGLFHDLASPLSSITLVAEYICAYADSDPKGVRDCAETLRRSCKDLGSLVQTIREYLADPKSSRRFSLSEQVTRAGMLLAHRARRAGGVEIITASEESSLIFARPLPILQIIVNLIANGIDACATKSAQSDTPSDYRGRVTISTEIKKGLARIIIRDNGIGMSAAVARRIFEPHFSTKDRSEGTGIGLSSVRMITQKILGGTISFETAPNEGAVFYIEFPVNTKSGVKSLETLE